MSSDRDAKPVLIVEEELINRAGLPVSQDDGPADQLLFGSIQFAEEFMARWSPLLEALMSFVFSHLGALVPARAVQRV